MAQSAQLVVHPLEPLFDERSRVLMLGSLPSPKSRERHFYYGNPQNRFWPVMAEALQEELPESNEERAAIAGASDASIRNPVPNDLDRILAVAPIQAIYATGSTAGTLYRRLIEPQLGRPITVLPSTSPANARWRVPALVEAYAQITQWL